MNSLTGNNSQTRWIVIRVLDVDLPNRIVHGQDKTNAKLQVSMRDIYGMLQIPNVGDKWSARRGSGSHQWYLEGRLDSQDESNWMFQNMSLGDSRILGGTLYIKATEEVVSDTFITTPTPEPGDSSTTLATTEFVSLANNIIVKGRVKGSDGSKLSSTGRINFTPSRSTTGTYAISFAADLSAIPEVLPSLATTEASVTAISASITNLANSGFTITTYDTTGSPADSDFSFVAIV